LARALEISCAQQCYVADSASVAGSASARGCTRDIPGSESTRALEISCAQQCYVADSASVARALEISCAQQCYVADSASVAGSASARGCTRDIPGSESTRAHEISIVEFEL